MNVPASPHFTPVSLDGAFNARRSALPEPLGTPARFVDVHGAQTIRGIPFAFGAVNGPDVILLDGNRISLDLCGVRAKYLVFVHAVEDVATEHGEGLEDVRGGEAGRLVSEYELQYEDGSTQAVPIRRRFAIQQARCGVAISPFACVAADEHMVIPAGDEAQLTGRPILEASALAGLDAVSAAGGEATRDLGASLYGRRQQTRSDAALTRAMSPIHGGALWLYALPNAHPERPLRAVMCHGREERSAIYALTSSGVVEHPLRAAVRRKLRLRLPPGVAFNAIGEVDHVGIDLGTVISARMALDYDDERWASEEAVVEPSRNEREAIVEYAAHPQARLYIGETVYEIRDTASRAVVEVAPARRPVRLRFVDRPSGAGLAVRLHLHGAAGEYLPPRGHHRNVNRVWNQDYFGEFVNLENQYAYVDGECIVDLPLGTVYVEITKGYEIAPVRTSIEVGPETDEVVFELENLLRWRERGWVTADTHVHFLSPQTALLEGQAEGVNVVNVLASQWGEMFSSVGDFDGKTTFGADDLDGRGEFLVRVGSENRMSVLGHISLLGYSGGLIHPLCSAGPAESAIGDPLEVTMAEWAQRCIDQNGLVVLPHAPNAQFEGCADVVLGLVHALELMSFNPLNPTTTHLNRYGVVHWYRYLNLGYHVPLVGGSDKMSAAMLLGGMRTYAKLPEGVLTYQGWMDAIRAGNTFATVGPLASVRVEGVEPGGQLRLPPGGGSLQVEWEVESVRLPIERVEVIVGGLVSEETTVGGELAARGQATVAVAQSTWIALRVRGSYRGQPEDIAAHTSAVQVLVEGSELFSQVDSMTVLDQIQGALAYVDTIAPRSEARRFQALRATLESAYARLHQRMHAAGVYHRHPLHDPAAPHEH